MRVLVCGSRSYNDTAQLTAVLQGIYEMEAIGWLTTHASHLTIVQGGARGADLMAYQWATTPGPHPADKPGRDDMGVFTETYPADWNHWGKSAGYRRNIQMLDSGVDLVVAFLDREMTKGTGHTVTEAKRRGLPVWEIVSNKRAQGVMA